MSGELVLIEIIADSVYVQFSDNDSDYVSFTKAKELIKNSSNPSIEFFSAGANSERAMNFINNVPFRTRSFCNDRAYLKLKEV